MRKRLDIENGFKYGLLTVMNELPKMVLPSGQKNRAFKSKCDFGNITKVRLVHLVRGRTISCGCIQKTRNGESNTKLFKVWKQIQRRCKTQDEYLRKKITVCKKWINSYQEFKKWALNNGYKEGLQIDRINNYESYSESNCRWVTSKVNCNNRENTFYVNYQEKKQSLQLLLVKLNKENYYPAILARIKRGWEHNKAIDTPIKKGNYRRKKMG